MNARPRLCVVLPSLAVGGTERQVLHLVEGLAAEFEIAVICTRERGQWAERVERFAKVSALGLRSGWDPRIRRRLRHAFRERRPDIVQSFMFGFDYWVNAAARREGAPVVVSSRRQRATWKKRRHVRLQRRANRMVDAIVANCGAVTAFASKQESEPRDKYAIIYNGVGAVATDVDAGRRARLALTIPHEAPVIGMVANYSPDKDHELFVGMAALIHGNRPDVHFVLAGDGPRRQDIQRTVVQLGLGDVFRFVSGSDDLAGLYAALDVVVLCSRTEGFPNVVLEAMAHGRPVVASDVGGVPEAIEDGITGRLIHDRTPGAFSEAVLALLDDREAAAHMGSRAAQRARDAFGISRMVAAYRDLYRDLLESKRGGSSA